MNLESAAELARQGKLYPAVILHGASRTTRLTAGMTLARMLLCVAEPEKRPCGDCRHCRRIRLPGDGAAFHPDVLVLERDLKTSTSVEATKGLLRTALVTPFEARGQVFVIADADTLSDGAANALLKTLEEPPISAPRHFLLLAPSAVDLLPTLRSRSLAIFLGVEESPLEEEELRELVEDLGSVVRAWLESGAASCLLSFAGRLQAGSGSFDDPRASQPWSVAARALLRLSQERETAPQLRLPLLDLAEALLLAPETRIRGVPPVRILEGLVCRHLGSRRAREEHGA